MSISRAEPAERDATADEIRALAHPLRLRILRVTLDQPLTNRQIAERLGRDPGTTLYHVRTLVRGGFLAPEEVRQGRRGALERPYRATGKSWHIRVPPDAGHTASILDAVREELLEAGRDAAIKTVRLGVRLRPSDIDELKRRIAELGDDFVNRDASDGQPIGILALIHRRRP